MTRATVQIDLETARIIANVFLPANPNKMRTAHPSVVQAAKDFKAAVAGACDADRAIAKARGQS